MSSGVRGNQDVFATCACSWCGYNFPSAFIDLASWCVLWYSRGDFFATFYRLSALALGLISWWKTRECKTGRSVCWTFLRKEKNVASHLGDREELFWREWGSEGGEGEGGRGVLPVTRVYFWAWAAKVLCTRHLPVKVQSPFQWLQFGMGCAQHLDVCKKSTDFCGDV